LRAVLAGLQRRLAATAEPDAALPLLEAALVALETAGGKGFPAQVRH